MRKIITLLTLFVAINSIAQQNFKRTLLLMGTRFEVTVVAENQVDGDRFIDQAISEIKRIENLISSWDKNSETSLVNSNAGIAPVKVSEELYNLIHRSIGLSKLTDGAFDISFASIDKLWKFDGSMKEMPTPEAVAKSVEKIGFSNIIIDPENHTVFLKHPGMKIGFGAIGKGYAADKAKQLLIETGVAGGIINASGDMNTWGKQANGSNWQVAITNPLDKNKAYGLLPITDGAVVTSGNYEKFVTFNNKRYAHIVDPRTGYPTTGLLSVTVFAPKAELADALATSIFVMGKETGLHLINQLPDIECILVDDFGNISTSNHIEIDTK